MKIGFVVDDTLDKPDGVQQYVLTLGRWLKSEGHDIHYLVGETHRTDIANIHSLSRNTHVSFNKNRLSIPRPISSKKIRELLQKEKFDVLHVQMPYSPMLAAKVVKYAPASTAIVGTFHIVPFSKSVQAGGKLLGLYLHRNLKRFDAVISVSRPAAQFAKSSFGLKNTITLPNVVDVQHLQYSKPLAKYNDKKVNVMFLGRLVERKGCDYLLQAIQELHAKQQLNNVRVLICGKGELSATLKQFVHDNHLGLIVHFVGFINENEKGDYLASANIAVFPSLGGESFGIVLIEAMAAGSEVVLAGNNAGYMSVMGPKTNQIIDPKNTKEFAKVLKHFILNGQARKTAQHWQSRHVQDYDVRVVGKQVVNIYEAAIAKRRQPYDNA